jgi:acyl-homoserine lactone acylase PvdQ
LHRLLAPLAVALALIPAAVAQADVNTTPADFSGEALNIIPSGQYGGAPVPAGADTQLKMYDALTPLAGNVTDADLLADFKSEKFGTPGSPGPSVVEATPRAGVTIVRDANDVPHIYGVTDDDVVWAAGWVLEEDRGLLLGFGRTPGRLAALDAPGIDAFSLVADLRTYTPTASVDKLIDQKETAALLAQGAPGKALLHDIDVYIQGINARLAFEHSTAKPFKRVDIYSINALAGQLFGQGGGDEVRRTEFYNGLLTKLGKKKGTEVFNDLSEHNDKDASTTISKSFPYEPIPAHATGNVIVRNNSFVPIAYSGVQARSARVVRHASNFQVVSGKRSATGHPLMVAGPQIGYYYPGLTLEMDLHGPTIDARGAAIPGGPGDILIGRGADFSWSLTSAGSDTNDQFAETLCGGSKHKYLFNGKCLSMTKIDAGTIAASGKNPPEIVDFYETVHGPVMGYAKTTAGKQVAISFDRSSRYQDILWQLPFKAASDGKVNSPQSFIKAFEVSPFTFNVPYIDNKHIAYFSAGRLPMRDPRVDPRLLTNGNGHYEWKGFLAPKAHPQAIDPASGELVNWNNKPAPGFGAADDTWNYGYGFRSDMILAGIQARPVHTLATVVGAMNNAATEDIREYAVLPLIDKVLQGSTAPNARDQAMLNALNAWRATGDNRIDADLDGFYDQGAAPVIMDTLWHTLADNALSPVLGTSLNTELSSLDGADTGSGQTSGRWWIVRKDLADQTGQKLKSPYAVKYCGAGNRAACQKSLWAAIDTAGNTLQTAQGSADPSAWKSDATKQRISFAPGVLPDTIRYTNRPSGIQQVITFDGHR